MSNITDSQICNIKEKINVQIAANDKLLEIEKRIQQQKEWLATIIGLVVASMLNVIYPLGIIAVIYVIYKQNKDLQEIIRLRKNYGL